MEAPVFYVYCDESYLPGPPKHVYRVQGGLWVPEPAMRAVRERFKAHRDRHPKIGEYKWEYVNGDVPMTAYVEIVDLFFEFAVRHGVCFRCIVIPNAEDPSQRLDRVEKDLGFFKAYYTFLHWRLRLNPGAHYHVRLDQKTSPRGCPEKELMRCLNAAARRDLPEPHTVLSCLPVSSHETDLVQMADVLCGAVGWAWNAMPTKRCAKPLLHQHICERLGWSTLANRVTGAGSVPFNVWRYRPQKR